MDSAAFAQLVVDALESLPAPFQARLANVDVIVERSPSREQRRALGLRPWQSVYGMYDGIPLTERTGDTLAPPDTIIIFQAPLERDFPSPIALCSEVRRTVLHEIAHVFGISDERLRDLGAY